MVVGYHDGSCLRLAGQTKYYIVNLEILKKISKLHGMISYSQTAPLVLGLYLVLPKTSVMRTFASKVNSF